MSTHPQAVSVASAALPARRDALEAFRAGYGRLLEWLVSSLMIILFVEVTAGVVFRGIGQSLIWYDEIGITDCTMLIGISGTLTSASVARIGMIDAPT
jgi:TRAP-type C4-dicarboxylate transport system permease small subunit